MFIRGESEELVLDDWAANRPAVDLHIRAAEISLVGADRPCDGGIGDCVESRVAPASYGRAVEHVGPSVSTFKVLRLRTGNWTITLFTTVNNVLLEPNWPPTGNSSIVTVSCNAPTANFRSTEMSPRTRTITCSCSAFLKPACSTAKVYSPGSTKSKT